MEQNMHESMEVSMDPWKLRWTYDFLSSESEFVLAQISRTKTSKILIMFFINKSIQIEKLVTLLEIEHSCPYLFSNYNYFTPS